MGPLVTLVGTTSPASLLFGFLIAGVGVVVSGVRLRNRRKYQNVNWSNGGNWGIYTLAPVLGLIFFGLYLLALTVGLIRGG